jgi:hypothetical protein
MTQEFNDEIAQQHWEGASERWNDQEIPSCRAARACEGRQERERKIKRDSFANASQFSANVDRVYSERFSSETKNLLASFRPGR